ncbi:hypothetical protein [Prosthecobacter sp.]|uniref:hypothetical protein n=1 Tax=Prosthecobacter sp. TaxID=1965333 RepID=UPI0024884803|nr:hypothetical protein [Prosthecobacter sp.]MDI1314725.1 hypothetical protein [Prosthecobacter sp.]
MKTFLSALLLVSSAALALDRPKLQIINAAPHAVEVFWVRPDGGRVSNGKLKPGQGSTIGTTLGHRFVIVDGGKETEVVSKEQVQEFRYSPNMQPQAIGTRPYDKRRIAGWTVHVNVKLIEADAPALEKAMQLLRTQLDEIVRVVPAKAVAELRKVPLYFNPVYPKERAHAAYHPNADWLRDHDHDPAMAKGVEFTNVSIFEAETRRMPNFALHELAHAYHDRVLGFENAEIEAAFQHAKAAGKYDQVQRQDSEGKKRLAKAYAMTNAKEYFAECSEAFFSRNDFFPFTAAELKQHDPEMFALLAKLWGTAAL